MLNISEIVKKTEEMFDLSQQPPVQLVVCY